VVTSTSMSCTADVRQGAGGTWRRSQDGQGAHHRAVPEGVVVPITGRCRNIGVYGDEGAVRRLTDSQRTLRSPERSDARTMTLGDWRRIARHSSTALRSGTPPPVPLRSAARPVGCEGRAMMRISRGCHGRRASGTPHQASSSRKTDHRRQGRSPPPSSSTISSRRRTSSSPTRLRSREGRPADDRFLVGKRRSR